MVACAAYGCTNSSRKQKAHEVKGWYYIPREEVNKDLRNRWIISIKREPPNPKDGNFAVCVLHFGDECFIRGFCSEFIEVENSNLKFKLKDGSVLTKFVFSKQKLQRRSSEQRAEKLNQPYLEKTLLEKMTLFSIIGNAKIFLVQRFGNSVISVCF